MPTILGANQLDTSYDVANSARFNRPNTAFLSRSISSTGSQTTMTVSCWVKRSNFGTEHTIFSNKISSSGINSMKLAFYSSDTLAFAHAKTDDTSRDIRTNRLFRDPAAWYHIVGTVDTTSGTQANRIRLYVNGVEETSFASSTYPAQNETLRLSNSSYPHTIGEDPRDNSHMDGYIAEMHFLDGVAYDPSYFGETNSNGVWVPKEYTGGNYGTNGFYMEFKQTGTSANSSGKGADTSGNDNHFDDSNMDTHDITEDSPTNNYCTMNPLYKSVTGSTNQMTYKNGALRVEGGSDSSSQSTVGLANGRWYWEVNYGQAVADRQGYPQIGVSKAGNVNNGQMVGFHTPDGSNYRGKIAGTVVANAFDGTPAQSDKIGFYLDLNNSTLIVHQNGSDFMGSGASSGLDFSSASFSPDTGFFHIHVNDNTDSTTISEFNFGNPAFSVSSGNTDANGYGNFEHSPTLSGTAYYAINSKNIAEFG